MDRAVLERAWLDSYDFPIDDIAKKRAILISRPAEKLAKEVYNAAMELRDEGINWYGSAFEDELLEVMRKGNAAIENPDKHIGLMEYKEVVEYRKKLENEDVALDETISAAKNAAKTEQGFNSKEKTDIGYTKE